MFKIASKPLATMAVLLILAACGKPAPPAAADPDPDADTTAPAVHVTSGNHSPTADYALSGVSWDDTGTTSVTWSLNGGDNQPAALSDTAFTANVTLAAGPNTIHVTARDAAGNEGSASRTVTFSPIPNTSAVSPEAALPGSAVTFTGTGLGDGGSVTVGGVTADTDSWSQSQVVFTVPAGAPPGPQPIVVSGTFGSTISTLFVGYDFPAGAFHELAAVNLPPGTAVRLAAGTYTGGPAGTVQLDNLSLHGQGHDQTFLELGPDVILDYRADADRDLLVQNLSLSVGRFSVGPNPAGFPGLSVQDLSTLALGSGSLTFSNVTWVESGAALPVIETHVAGWPYQGSIHFVDSQLDLPQTEVNLDPLGSLELVTTTIDASSLGSDIRFGRLTLDSANITADGPVFFNVESGMAISNSTLTSVSRSVELGHRNTADLFTGTETVISNSQFNGSEAMYWWFGPDTRLLIEGSELHSDEEIEIRIEDSGRAHINTTEFTSANSFIELHFQPASESLVVDNVLNSGEGIHLVAYPAALVTFDRNQVNSDYNFSMYSEAAVFTAEANTFRLAIDPAATDSDAAFTGISITSGFTLHDNTFTWESAAGGARLFGNGSFTLTDNILTGFENSGTALFMWRLTTQDEATVTATGNRFESFENALVFNLAGSFPGLFDARINGNVFDFPMTAAPQAARVSYSQDGNTSLDATNNVWHDFTTAAEVEALIAYDVSTAVLTVDPVTPFVAP